MTPPVRLLAFATVMACPVFLAGLYFDSFAMRLFAKPWPHLLLIAWVLAAGSGTYARRIDGAIAVCMIADILLEFRQTLFVHGMAVFLGAQLMFARAFTMRCLAFHPRTAIPFLVWLGVALVLLWPRLGEMEGPILAYMTAIGLMMWRAAVWASSPRSNWPAERSASRRALAGAIVFGISDTMIAIHRFYMPLPAARYMIIVTYWAALALIAWSAIPPASD